MTKANTMTIGTTVAIPLPKPTTYRSHERSERLSDGREKYTYRHEKAIALIVTEDGSVWAVTMNNNIIDETYDGLSFPDDVCEYGWRCKGHAVITNDGAL